MTSNARTYSTFGSTIIAVTIRWTDRLIGIVSTFVLARLLAPDDFGIIAMASLVIALAEMLLSMGVHVALIQNTNASQAHYDTAWTIRLLQTALSTSILFIAASFAADFFQDVRVLPVLQLLALMPLLGGLENIGLIEFQKRMQFGAEFRFLFSRRIVGVATTIVAALSLRSYWALVIGMLTGQGFGIILSYWLHPMRPRISFAKFREIFGVSQWMLVHSMAAYLQRHLHRILVGRWDSTSTLGAYSLANEISSMPTNELLAPVNRALFPAFAKEKERLSQLKNLFLVAQSVQTLIAVPAAVGLAVIARDAVPLLLGEKWISAIPFIQVLALVNIAQALTSSGRYVLIVLGHVRLVALYLWGQVGLFAALALTVWFDSDAISIATLRLGIGAVGLWLLAWLLIRVFPVLSAREFVAGSLRPLLAAGAMAAVVTFFSDHLQMPVAIALILKVAIGALVYVTVVGVLWWLSGKPHGGESYIVDKAHSLMGRRRKSNAGAN